MNVAITVKPFSSISLDLDDKWTYLKTHGDSAWKEYPSYLSVVVPRILRFLAARNLTISFFIVGHDASRKENHDVLRAIAEAGHEIANHSFHHDPWLHLYSDEQFDEELAEAEHHISQATGARPIGFRGPGFSISRNTLNALVKRNYQYDATTFPNALNPLARAYFLAHSKLDGEERRRRKALFGSATDAFRSCKPYWWNLDGCRLLEIPVTTMPLLKVPIHFSYLIYLSGHSSAIARSYLRTALTLCRMTGTEPSLLLHPLDFLGSDDDDGDLAFFPGMDIDGNCKSRILDELFDIIEHRFDVVTIESHVAAIERKGNLPLRSPRFGRRDKSTACTNGQPQSGYGAGH